MSLHSSIPLLIQELRYHCLIGATPTEELTKSLGWTQSVQYLLRLESLWPQLGNVGSFPAQTPYNQYVGTTGEEQGRRINGAALTGNLTWNLFFLSKRQAAETHIVSGNSKNFLHCFFPSLFLFFSYLHSHVPWVDMKAFCSLEFIFDRNKSFSLVSHYCVHSCNHLCSWTFAIIFLILSNAWCFSVLTPMILLLLSASRCVKAESLHTSVRPAKVTLVTPIHQH